MATGGNTCRFYGSLRGCWFGDECKFVHDEVGHVSNSSCNKDPQTQQTLRCRYYRTPKGCRYGPQCSYRHDDDETRLDLEMKDIGHKIKSLSLNHNTANFESLEQEETSQRADCHETYENLLVTYKFNDGEIKECEQGLEEEEEIKGDLHADDVYDFDDDADKDDDEAEEVKGEEEQSEEGVDGEKEMQKPDIKKATCGECGSVLLGDDAFDMLKDHYLEQFKKFNHSHLAFLQSDFQFGESTMCLLCDRLFACSKDLLRHTVDKSKRTDSDGEEHTFIIEKSIVEPFCFRDTVHHDEEKLRDELVLALYNDPFDSDDDDSDDDSDDDDNFMGALPLGFLLMGSHGNSFHGNFVDEDDDSDDGGMYGFSEDDCFELLCQGVKPWDPEAGDVLAVLNGWM